MSHECECGHNHGHNHDECECGCGHDQTVVISMDGEEVECTVLGVFGCGELEYIALLPMDSEESLLFRYSEKDDGGIELGNIESDEEFNAVSEAFFEAVMDDDEDWDDDVEDMDDEDWEDDDFDDESGDEAEDE